MVCDVTMGPDEFEALRFARDSLKIDQKYNILYEGDEDTEGATENPSNGDMIKTLFPNAEIRFTDTDEYTNKPRTVVITLGGYEHRIRACLWNAPYKGAFL